MAAGFGASLPQRHQSFDEAALAGVALPNGLKSKTECLDTALSFGKPLEIEKKGGGLVIAARVAAPDFVFDIRPDAFALAVNRVEPDPASFLGCFHLQSSLRRGHLRLGMLASKADFIGTGLQFGDSAQAVG